MTTPRAENCPTVSSATPAVFFCILAPHPPTPPNCAGIAGSTYRQSGPRIIQTLAPDPCTPTVVARQGVCYRTAMPTYEYQCESCKRTFSVEQRITEPPLQTCIRQRCHGAVKRLISPTTFVLRGTGWYRDGYGR